MLIYDFFFLLLDNVFFLQGFLVATIHMLPTNAQLPSPKVIVGISGALMPQIPDTSKETKETTTTKNGIKNMAKGATWN